ncbi:choice-of-anchor D domain-containing protein [Sulfitobacter sp. D35]|uniref:choice-of-anchor D domain-containing protein n=1 Tax=Sulfitobacter sp. D35 TaxID=3083252 RepID=UPI00296E908F|nr:choice-of-anchor D domain-containing protein [Sulfitobacter sp. D35]MDW4497964.1 choice-of-anchor D domain-containing protein [Sulfitobacter sp. D35]
MTSLFVAPWVAASAAGASTYVLSGYSLNFEDTYQGDTSATQAVEVTNVSDQTVTPSFAGGAPSGEFTAVQNCAAATLAPGASCQFFYTYVPTTLGASSGTSNIQIDGETFSIALQGVSLQPYLVSPTALDFGPVESGEVSAAQQVSFTNVTNATQTYSFAGGAPTGDFTAVQNCAGGVLAPGASCQFTYSFAPTADVPASGTSNISVNGDLVSISLTGLGSDTAASPFVVSGTDLSFGHVYEGETSAVQTVNVTNVSDEIQSPSFAGGAPSGDFSAVQNCAGGNILPGASCQFFYSFTPTAEGTASGVSSFSIDGEAYTVQLNGTGLDPLLVSPLSLDFGEVEVGQSSSLQLISEITNVSGVTQTYSLAGGAPSGGFGAVQNCAGGVLAPGASCQFFYSFSPTSAGAHVSQSVFSIDGKPVVIDLAGTGTGGTTPPPGVVPLPASLPLLSFGVALLPLLARRRRTVLR